LTRFFRRSEAKNLSIQAIILPLAEFRFQPHSRIPLIGSSLKKDLNFLEIKDRVRHSGAAFRIFHPNWVTHLFSYFRFPGSISHNRVSWKKMRMYLVVVGKLLKSLGQYLLRLYSVNQTRFFFHSAFKLEPHPTSLFQVICINIWLGYISLGYGRLDKTR